MKRGANCDEDSTRLLLFVSRGLFIAAQNHCWGPATTDP